MLLERSADADGSGEGGFAPVHTAAQHGDIELVRLLLAHGADPLRPTDDGKSPRDLARHGGHDGCVRLLEEAPAGAPT